MSVTSGWRWVEHDCQECGRVFGRLQSDTAEQPFTCSDCLYDRLIIPVFSQECIDDRHDQCSLYPAHCTCECHDPRGWDR